MSDTQTSGKGRGCFFYGCLTLVIVCLVGAIGLYFGTRYAINKLVSQYTAAAPMDIPKVEGTPEEVKGVQERFSKFAEALKAGQSAEPVEALSLSEKDLNLLINNAPDVAQFKNAIHVAIVDKKLRGTLSLPLESLGWKSLRGRYFNGVADLKASLQEGVFVVTLDALEVNGKAVPEQAMAGIRSQNLAKDLYKDARSIEVLKKIETILVEDGRVLVKPRSP